MVAKLSSVMTIFAASFATSVPVMPIATPTSAVTSAGASFTPSPVIATTLSLRLVGLDDAQLLRGMNAGEDGDAIEARRASSGSDMRSSSRPSTAMSPSRAMPSVRAIARPVAL